MSNTCQNCGIATKYNYCKYCAEWLARIDDHKIKLRQAKEGNRPKRKKQMYICQQKTAIESFKWNLANRKKNSGLLRNGLRFVGKARA